MDKKEKFSNIIIKYKIKCFNEIFYKIILKKYNNIKITDQIDSNTLLIGIPNKINIIKKLNILILGDEIQNNKILEYFLKNKEKINFFSLSQLSSQYYLKNFNINSTIIIFDNLLYNDNGQKLIYFNQNNDNDYKNDNEKDFNKYINNYNDLFNINELKIIIFENFEYIWNPYSNIFYELFPERIKIDNFYYQHSLIYLKKFNDISKNSINKYIFMKINMKYIKNYIDFISNISNEIKYLYTTKDKKEYNINCSSKNYNESLIIISDNLLYLESLIKPNICKIYISTTDICLIENNIIHIHENFFIKKIPELNIECKNISFIVDNKKDILYLENYLKFYKKYFPEKKIKIFANPILKIKDAIDIKSFVAEENTKIFFSQDYSIYPHLSNILFFNNIEIKIIQKLHVLVASTQYTSYGGAATNAYNIIKYLQTKKENYFTSGIFINNVTSNDVINPDNLNNISGISYSNYEDKNIYYYLYKQFESSPDIAFCKNCMAPKIIKKIFPNTAIIFLVSGIMGFSEIDCGANEIKDYSLMQKRQEKDSILISNIIVCNSQLTLDYYRKIYKDTIEKKNNLALQPFDSTKYNTIHFSNEYKNKTTNKNIDIIVVASNVNRTVKNIGFIQKLLASSTKLRNYKIMIIGNNTNTMFANIPNIEILPLQKQEEVDAYLGKSKVIIIPSLFDSNSNTFREAIMLNVIPIISINVAHPKDYPSYFVIDNYKWEEWETKIIYTLNNFNKLGKNHDLKKYFENNDQIETYL
jgi:hypothetical protein